MKEGRRFESDGCTIQVRSSNHFKGRKVGIRGLGTVAGAVEWDEDVVIGRVGGFRGGGAKGS
jgi:hypothetical protein